MDETELIQKYEALIFKIAKKFYNVELSDLYQAGCIGLIKAYRKYEAEKGSSFINYAYMHIFGEMHELANKSRDIQLNKAYLNAYKRIKTSETKLYELLGRKPSLTEISLDTNIPEDMISEVIILTSQMLSIEEEYQTLNGDSVAIKDCIGQEEDIDSQILIDDSLNNLEPLEQDVIKIRFFNDLTQTETAKVLGISQVKVSRLETKGKQKIKEYIAA